MRCRHNLAVNLGRPGRFGASHRMTREVAAARARVLGPDHPDTLTARDDEAHCLEQLRRSTEAVELYRRVAVVRRRTPHPHRPPAADCRPPTADCWPQGRVARAVGVRSPLAQWITACYQEP
ncbi:tetratricopeptide repeat protein [Streptomyces sp. HMX87]|uniref:tetratricopeptide repeat protein n=1 Tax=Streptomyces sp. HMX87 TaxID=3390849 RepID=UPI003A8585F2